MSNTPDLIDLVQELRGAIGLFDGAMSISPKEAWEEAIREVQRVREVAVNGYCWKCEERARWDGPGLKEQQ